MWFQVRCGHLIYLGSILRGNLLIWASFLSLSIFRLGLCRSISLILGPERLDLNFSLLEDCIQLAVNGEEITNLAALHVHDSALLPTLFFKPLILGPDVALGIPFLTFLWLQALWSEHELISFCQLRHWLINLPMLTSLTSRSDDVGNLHVIWPCNIYLLILMHVVRCCSDILVTWTSLHRLTRPFIATLSN